MKKYYIQENKEIKELDYNNIICTFKTEDGAPYIAYTYYEKDSNGGLIVYGAKIGNDNVLLPIPGDEKYIIEDCIKVIREKYKTEGDKNE